MTELATQLEQLRRAIAAHRREHAHALDVAEMETLELLTLTLTEMSREGAVDVFAIRDLVRLLRRLPDARYPWVVDAVGGIEPYIAGDIGVDTDTIEHQLEVGRRVLSTHRFMEGRGGALDFRQVVTRPNGDIQVGLGLGLEDGGLRKLLVCLAGEGGGRSAKLALSPFFDTEADTLAEFLESDPGLLEEYLRSQLVLRHDSRLRRLVHELPDPWPMRFQRLAASLEARRLQLELAAGSRLISARNLATRHDLDSLRGLAFAFEVQPLLGNRMGQTSSQSSGESGRMFNLADRVLARVKGSAYQHWSSRVQALIEGQGQVSGRRYDEQRMLGAGADAQPWQYESSRALHSEGSGDHPTSVPVPGRDYVVQPGDRLSQVARQAYSGKADYRYLLSANPHLRSPSSLLTGQRIHIPHWPPSRPTGRAADSIAVAERIPRASGGSRARVERDLIVLPGRSLGPFPGDDRAVRCEQIAQTLAGCDPEALEQAHAVRLPEGWAVMAEAKLLFRLIDEDLPVASAKCPDAVDPLASWAAWLAAELRGDVILGPGWFLPLSLSKRDPFRRRWLRAALLKALTEQRLKEASLVYDPRAHTVGLEDREGQTLALLLPEDIERMRRRPDQRLSEVPKGGPSTVLVLAKLWLSWLRQDGVELLLPPLNDVRRFPTRKVEDGVLYLAPMGAAVFPTAAGEVCLAGPSGAAGNAILIDHGEGLFSRYAHLASVRIRPGQTVQAGQMIGRVGMSGEAMEPGLFFALERRPSGAAPFGQTWRVSGAKHLAVERALLGPSKPWTGITSRVTSDESLP